MGLLQWLGLTRVDESPAGESTPSFGGPRPLTFGLEAPQEVTGVSTPAGIAPRISRAEALQVPAVLRARNLICGSLATLPVRVHAPDRRVVTDVRYVVPQPDPDIPQSVVVAQTVEDLLFEGVAWWRVTRFGWHGYPVEARHVPVNAVHVAPASGAIMPSQRLISPDQPYPADGAVYIDGIRVRDEEIIRFDSPNPPLLVHAARAIRAALLLDQTTTRYAKEPLPLGYFTPKEGADPASDDEIQEVLDKWEMARAKRAWGFVNGALDLNTLQWNPDQLQLADQRQHAVLEIARAAGVDPEDLGVSTTSRTYQNSEQRRQDLLDFTLGAYVSAIQDRLSMRDILPRGYVSRIDFAGFLRSDTKTRMETYEIGLRVGAYTPEEIRELEDRPPLPTGQRPQPQPRTVAPNMEDSDVVDIDEPNRISFEGDEGTRITFAGDEVAASFRVNPDKRTISGVAVPWHKVARSGFAKWKFAEGSLHWSADARVKMNLDHERSQTVGRGVRLQSTPKGLDVTFQVARGDDGTRALEYAEDGVYDGFSIEVDFDGEADGWTSDPSDESVRLVHSATLRAVALTAMPAFDDARVTRVAASRDQEGKGVMPEDNKPETGAGQQSGTVALQADEFTKFMDGMATQVAESHKNLTEELTKSLGESFSAGIKAALENLHDPQRDGPEPVRAARFQVTREAPVYTFDGRGESLVRDAWYAQREHDSEAQERIRRFQQQSADVQRLVSSHVAFNAGGRAQFATVDTTTASDVIPPGYRPDLFVPQLEQGRPLVNMLSRGTISNATPFVVPTFGSATGMTGDHTEGSPPGEGTLVLGSKTVAPGAISGKLPLTREIVDSSNPAIDQIALAAMREDYAQQTETKVYTALNGAASTTLTLAAGSAGGNADGAEVAAKIRELLAKFPFTRFAAPTGAAMNQNATVALATINDSTGRPLFPSVGAQNTSGIGNAVRQAWFVDGLAFVPAWAMGDAISDDVVFILNMADVWVWESPTLAFRFEEKQGPEIIELALFGYFASHVLRPAGVFAIENAAT